MPVTEPPRRRRLPAGQPLVLFRSRGSGDPRLHEQVGCPGLQRTVAKHIGQIRAGDEPTALELVEFADLAALAAAEQLPCRACTLERVLDTVLRPVSPAERLVFASFSGQPNALRFRRGLDAWRKVSDSGEQRLLRIAERLGLPVVETPAGPVAYGMLPERGVEVLARSLRTYTLPGAVVPPPVEVVAYAWALLCDDPPERHTGLELPAPDPWQVAALLAAT